MTGDAAGRPRAARRRPLDMRALKAGLAYFSLVFGAGFVLGTIRVPLLVPRLGVRTAELLEMPVMLVAIVLSARFVVRRFALPAGSSARLTTGLIALALLVTAEITMAVILAGVPLTEYIAGRDPVSGSVFLVMLLLYAVMPLIVARDVRPRR